MKRYYFYINTDKNKEPIMSYTAFSRLKAANYFAAIKQMDLKTFLTLFSISR